MTAKGSNEMAGDNSSIKSVPIPTVRTTIHKNKLKNNSNIVETKLIESDNGSNDDERTHSLLENTKPPSIIDHSSLMSHSSASSINSEISDIGLDLIPIRKLSESNQKIVAAAASDYAKEINTLVQSCNIVSSNENISGSNSRTFEIVNFNPQGDHGHDLMVNSGTIHKSKKQDDACVDTRTFDKFDPNNNKKKNNKNDQFKYYDSDQSDTDISEVLPYDNDVDNDITIQQKSQSSSNEFQSR